MLSAHNEKVFECLDALEREQVASALENLRELGFNNITNVGQLLRLVNEKLVDSGADSENVTALLNKVCPLASKRKFNGSHRKHNVVPYTKHTAIRHHALPARVERRWWVKSRAFAVNYMQPDSAYGTGMYKVLSDTSKLASSPSGPFSSSPIPCASSP